MGKVTGDFLINILASVIYTFARQIVVFPLLAARLGEADYGTLLTVTGLVNVCTAIVGNSLNNVRLVQNSCYEEQGISGDFNLLCIIGSVASAMFSLLLWLLFDYSWLTALLLTAYLLVSNLYQYATVFYRLELNFKRHLIVHVLVSAAYVAAAFVFATQQLWPMVFLIAEGVGLIYVCVTTQFYKETFRKTPFFKETSKKMIALILAGLVANLLTYADRIILYPFLGAESVSYYSTAAFFGKSISIVMVPIAGVLLSYFSQKGFSASRKLFVLVNGVSDLFLMVFLVGCWLFAPWFTKLLYPTLYEYAAPYIMLANFGATISIAGNMAQPMIIKCCSTRWLLIPQAVYAASYLLFSLWLLPLHGLLGFCWATILSNTVRLAILYIIGFAKFK